MKRVHDPVKALSSLLPLLYVKLVSQGQKIGGKQIKTDTPIVLSNIQKRYSGNYDVKLIPGKLQTEFLCNYLDIIWGRMAH